MFYHSANTRLTGGEYLLPGAVQAVAHPCLCKPLMAELWHNFSYRASDLEACEGKALSFTVGNTKPLPLDGYAYSIRVDEGGVCLCAENERELVHGYMALIERIKAVDESRVVLECCELRDRDWIANKMVHYCIFPETELWELERFVRFCGALRYTHIVLEFWGMLKYACMKELSWEHGFTKDQIRPIIQTARDMGMEVIPMFNHWGHAAGSRSIHGKHVVLDQNPALQSYFTEDGWCWNIHSQKVRALLGKIRAELIELCGESLYFHIGCDEAYGFELTEKNMSVLCDFINEVEKDLFAQGRRTILWGDMFLYKKPEYNPENRYSCHAESAETAAFLMAHLDRRLIIADWQYHSPCAPVETAREFTQAGFECLLCPYDDGGPQVNAVLETVRAQGLLGVMHTTWHTLSRGMPYVMQTAYGGLEKTDSYSFHFVCVRSAALLRRVAPVNGSYRQAGWSKKQIDVRW